MILGTGVDIVDVVGFETQLEDPASHFVEETFTIRERKTASHRPGQRPGRHLAVRFAAKEAFIKAWSCALWGQPPVLQHVMMCEIEVVSDSFGRPGLQLHGQVAEALQPLGPLRIHLSLSHDGDMAVAFVVLEKVESPSSN